MKKINLIISLLAIGQTFYSFHQLENVFLQNSHKEKNNSFLELLSNSQRCSSWQEVMNIGLSAVDLDGFYLEMGVFQAKTINFIAALQPNKIIYGFDSFEGLPEAWSRDDTNLFQQGFFALPGLPAVRKNVVLFKGWFDNTLPKFKQELLQDNTIAFLHIDCDLYSSTKTIFEVLGNNIKPGTILVFDELYNYAGFDRHELKALYEFLAAKNYTVEYLAYNALHEQVALRIIE